MSSRGVRLDFLDVMKGFTIFLVVWGHALSQISLNHPLKIWIYTFHMPFFFLLSGFLAIRLVNRNLIYNFSNKFRSLILPFLFCGISYSLISNNIDNYINDLYHAGYWYLFSLFICWMLFLLIYKILQIIHLNNSLIFEFLFLITPFFVGNLIMEEVLPEYMSIALTLPLTVSYYRFFVLGYFIGRFWNKFNNKFNMVLNNEIVISISIILFLGTSYYIIDINQGIMTLKQILLCLSLFVILFNYKTYLYTFFYKFLSFLGICSLEIYTFHYLFIYKFTHNSIKTLPSGTQTVITILISIIVIILSLFVSRLFKNNKVLSFLFLGQKLKTNN